MSVQVIDHIPYYTTPNGTVWAAGGNDVNCTISVCPVELSVYGYRPSLPFSALMIALYGLCIIVQTVLGWRYRTWGFMAANVLGCVDEIIGYAGRILYYNNPWGDAGFIIQIVLITIGPVFFSAAIYVMIYLIIRYMSTEHSRFKPQLFYWIFIPCDIISLILQAVGGAMSSTSNGKSQSAVDISLAGLSFQIITLFVFGVACIDYAIRSRHVWRSPNVVISRRFKNFLFWLTLATVTIFVRCCYRVDELKGGYSRDNESLGNEPLFIGLEGVMIIVAAWALVAAHPGFVFKPNEQTPAKQIAETEKVQPSV